MSYQILFTDLDGTLLNSRSEISETNREAIAAAFSAGKQVVICSGRSYLSLDYFERILGLNAPGRYGISFNGAVIYRTADKFFLREQPMTNELGLALTKELKNIKADVLMYVGAELLVEQMSPDLRHYIDSSRLKMRLINDFTTVTGDVIKIISRGTNDQLKEVARHMERTFGDQCDICFSAENLLEFSHPEANKGGASAFLAAHLGYPPDAVITMGDQANDISMLKTAGLGVAVANAIPEAKAAADVCLRETNDEHAVSRVIYDYLLA